MDASGAAPSSAARRPVLAKYDVLDEIGHGGMATVYRAVDKRLGREVAVKVIHPHLRDSPEVAHRFFVEAKAVAKLRHPNIVEVFDVSEEGEAEQYLVCELVRGISLRKLLQKNGALPPEVAAAVAIDLLGALSHAHAAGVIHRDVKPENVIIEHRPPLPAASEGAGRASPADGPGERVAVKLTDFGIAKLLDAQGVTSTGQVLGSPAHMAPEQIEGGDVDARADVFGLGVLLYECMVGHLPFEGNNPAQVLRRVLEGQYPPAEQERQNVGRAWSEILDRALAHKPEERFHDGAAMREAFAAELARLGVTSPRSELEAWCDSPGDYAEAHAKRMIERLCQLAAQARKQGRVLAAAADYNRALAYAPGDPALLRIVASLHRAEARARFLKRAARLAAATIGIGAVTFFVGREVRSRFIVADPPLKPSPSMSVVKPVPSATQDPVATVSAAPSVSVSVTVVHPLPPASSITKAPPPPKDRRVSVNVFPPQVLLSIDGQGTEPYSAGTPLVVDATKSHSFELSCAGDICEPGSLSVAPGEDDAQLSLSLKFIPCMLTVHGDGSSTYRLQDPPIQLAPDMAMAVPMHGSRSYAEVIAFARNGAQKTAGVTLRAAGKAEVWPRDFKDTQLPRDQ
jgi:eukaryotic-like serine/threonine-protein kinase